MFLVFLVFLVNISRDMCVRAYTRACARAYVPAREALGTLGTVGFSMTCTRNSTRNSTGNNPSLTGNRNYLN